MAYRKPPLKALMQIAFILNVNYDGHNSRRLQFIKFYERLSNQLTHHYPSEEACEILLGALVFEMEWIKLKEYYGFSAQLKNKFFYHSGSRLYTEIKKKLNIFEHNPLSDDEQLVYVFCFYNAINHLQRVYSDFIESHENLLIDIVEVLKHIKQRQAKRIAIFAEGEPSLVALQKNIYQLARNYQQAAASRWFKNTKREALIQFIKLINQAYLKETGSHPTPTHDIDKDFAYLNTCTVQLGVFLFALLNIYKEYGLLPATRSQLFKQCLQALNIQKLNAITVDKKIVWLEALSKFLRKIKKNHLYDELIQSVPVGVRYHFSEFQNMVDGYLFEEQIKKKQLSPLAQYMTQVTSSFAQYGMGIAFAQLMSEVALPGVGATLGGPVGFVVYGTGAIVATQLGRLVSDRVIDKSISYIYAMVLEKIGYAIAHKTVGAVTYTFSVSKEGLHHLLAHPALPTEDRIFIKRWINTLLQVSDEVVSNKDKQKIRAMLGLESTLVLTTLDEPNPALGLTKS